MTTALATTDYLAKLQESAPPDILHLDLGMAYGQQRKYVTVKVPDSFSTLELSMLTDMQFGHLECRVDRIKEYVDWLLSVPNRFCVLGGDMVDAAHALSVGSPYENACEPKEQVFEFAELLMPLRARILGYVGGNHERRTIKQFGSLGSLIANLLRIPYSDGKQFIDIYFGKHAPFKVELWHGRGAARTKGARAQMIHQFMQQGEAHLYLCGHLHDAMLLWDWRQVRDHRHGRIRLQKIAGVMSSSFLSYWATYAEVAGLSASDVMMARAIIEPNGHWEVTMK